MSVVAALLVGCTGAGDPGPSDPGTELSRDPAVVVERDVSGQRLELGPALGGSALVGPPRPGRYAVAVRFTQHRFVTMEHTVHESIEGSAVIELTDGGEVRACFAVADRSASDISHYQAHDGQDHHYESDTDNLLGARGRWVPVAGTHEIELHLDRLGYRSCEVGDELSPEPLTLRCSSIASTSKIPSAALVCQPAQVPAQRMLGQLSLMLGEDARSWGLRNDLALHDPPVGAEVQPYLLLGVGDGLSVVGSDDRSGRTLEVELAKVPDPSLDPSLDPTPLP
ncbi:hypothetical protein ENSA7_25990 [Enhygromyxa salina]|uniref:Uncharacterized protein n=1 Tax=Enhygromyxa salina TaxID=215803 RepID=A0A2S9YRC0_9BACT|nr:hypothetical protein ENSA7_25990 [Enhygromyxa salina]